MSTKRNIGIVGYGHLGQFLVKEIKRHPQLELGFVWNRTPIDIKSHSTLKANDILGDLANFADKKCDLIVEVAHPSITLNYGSAFLEHCDFMIGSPAAMADPKLHAMLRTSAKQHGLYVPSGAFWGAEDIRKMADCGTLKKLKVTMTKHPSSLRLEGHLVQECKNICGTEAVTLYEGPVRGLCPLAPNNVNTMAVAAVAAHNLGFDGVTGCLIADPKLLGWHTIETLVTGPRCDDREFIVNIVRRNPADASSVTGSATFNSFFSSLLGAQGKGPGIHLC